MDEDSDPVGYVKFSCLPYPDHRRFWSDPDPTCKLFQGVGHADERVQQGMC